MSLTLLPAFENLILLMACLVKLQCKGRCLLLLKLVMPGWLISMGILLFNEGKKEGSGSEG